MRSKESSKKQKDLKTIRWVIAWGRGYYRYVFFLVFSSVVSAVCSVWFALVSRSLVDSAMGGVYSELIRNGIWLLALIVGQIGLSLVTQAVSDYINAKLRMVFQDKLLALLLEREYSATVKYHSGDILHRMYSDVAVVQGGIISILPSVVYLVIRLVGAAAVLLMIAPEFTLLFLAVGLVICLVTAFFRGRLKDLHKRVQAASAQVRAFLQDTLERLLVIKVFGAGGEVRKKAWEYQNDYFRARMQRRAISLLAGAGFGFIFQMGSFLALAVGCFGIFYGTMTYGTLTAMLQLVNQIQSPFSGFSSLITQTYAVIASAERLIELEALPEETESCARTREEQYRCLKSIRFENVDFTYGRSPVLTDVNIQIDKGDFVALTGLSGGGKSTLFLLMLGAYRAGSGKVAFDFSEPPVELPPGKSTRQLFAYVPQGNHLMSGTLRDNATFFKRDVEDPAIYEALRIACAEEFVSELPEGLDTVLGEKGHGLSEGQMQRVAIARAVLSGAPVLLFDESTSALDEETEAKLLNNIKSLQNRTCLIVTHRKAALSICDKHLYILNGHVCLAAEEEGIFLPQ